MVTPGAQITAERIGRLRSEGSLQTFAEATALAAQGKDIIHLELGEPDFATPANIVAAGIKALHDGHTHYAPVAGIPPLRSAIADHVSSTRGIDVRPEQVVVTPGSKLVALFTFLAVVEAGDEVISFDPGFPLYESLISFVEATPVLIPLVEEMGFRPRSEDIVQKVSGRTKLIILNSPHNPTGGILSAGDLQRLAELGQKYEFFVLSDEIYGTLLYEGEFCSIAQSPGMKERTVILGGFSKSHAMTGWRLGYGVFPEILVQAISTLVINSYSCVAPFIQWAGVEALRGPQTETERMAQVYRRRRDHMVDGLNAIPGVRCQKTPGAFYVFPNVASFGKPSSEIAHYLLHQAGVATLPGTAFGRCGEGYLRLSYANSEENISRALERISEALGKL